MRLLSGLPRNTERLLCACAVGAAHEDRDRRSSGRKSPVGRSMNEHHNSLRSHLLRNSRPRVVVACDYNAHTQEIAAGEIKSSRPA